MRGNHVLLRRSLFLFGAFAVFGTFAGPVSAQIVNGNLWPNPRLATLTPAGGKVGTTFEVAFSGSDLGNPESLVFSHPGIKATPIVPPLPTPDPKVKPDPTKKIEPLPITKFSVVIAKDVPLGFYDVRFVNKLGVSNPRVFVVGDLEEAAEKEPNNDIEQAQKIDLGTTITGVVAAPTDVDYSSFVGKKGQRILISCWTASIDSKLHPEIRVFDNDQRQLAYHRPLPGRDGLLDVTLPADGVFFIRLNQFTYTLAAADYYYRLNISTGPWIDAIFPPVLEPGKATPVTIYGRNLPGGKIDPDAVLDGKMLEKSTATVTAPAGEGQLNFSGLVPPPQALLDGFEYRMGNSNPYLLTLSSLPVVVEEDKNDTPETAQVLKLPCEVAGRVDKKRDRDWFTFQAQKSDVLIIELQSNRIGAPTDMYFSLRNLETKAEITLQDDNAETLSTKSFYTVTKDPPPYRFVVPADGKFHLLVASHIGDILTDPQHMYRLRISTERPDFRLFVMPAEDYRPDSCQLGQGGVQNFQVFASRIDGFKGDIVLEMDGLPAGVTCPPQVLAGGQKSALVAVLAADNAAAFTGPIKLKGTSIVNGQKVIREARPATVTWTTGPQQNIATVTRLDRSLFLAVRDKAPAKLVAGKDKIVTSLGDKADLPFKFIRHDANFKGNFQVAPIAGELPTGVTFANLTFTPGKDDQQAVVTVAANAIPGTYNLVFRGFAPIAPDAKVNKPVNTILPSTPVQLVILPKQVANLTVDNANPTVKLGADGVVIVKVARLFDYNDAFKVQLVLPKEVQGISADDITIAPGQNEAKLTLKVPASTPPGQRQNITIRALAVVNGNVTLTHETKINVNLVK